MQQDEERAAWLARALAGEDPLPEAADDAELAELAALGADLARRGPELMLLAQADERFDPAFATRLRGTLLAAHPTAPAGAAGAARPEAGARPAQPRRRRAFRLLLALAALAAIATVALIFSVVQNMQLGFQTGTAAPTPTRQPAAQHAAPRAGIFSTAANSGAAPSPGESAPLATPQRAPTGAVEPRPLVMAPMQRTPTQAAGGAAPSSHAGAAQARPTPQAGSDALPPRSASPPPIPADSYGAVSPGAVAYHLPVVLPPAPATVPVYTLRPLPMSEREVSAIVARFPGLRPLAVPPSMRFYSDGQRRLAVLRAIGQVDYTAPPGPARQGTLGPAAAIRAARDWLVGHELYPSGVDERSITVQRSGTIISVRFVPSLPLPLVGADTSISLIVDLDSAGGVVSAHRLWAQVQRSGSIAVLPPSVAARRHSAAPRSPSPVAGAKGAGGQGAPEPRTFVVQRVTLAYAPAVGAGGSRLLPVYVLRGYLQGAGGVSQPLTQTIPASSGGGG